MAGLRYAVSGYCTECGEVVAEVDGDDPVEAAGEIVDRAEWAQGRHAEREHG